jgi:Flp pilus assembly protein TadG
VSRAFLQDEQGGSAIEFAILAPILAFAIMATLQLGIMGFNIAALNDAVVDASRQIRTGRSDGPADLGAFKALVCEEFGFGASDCSERISVSVLKVVRFSDLTAHLDDPMVDEFDKGAPGDIMLVRVNYRMPMIVPVIALNGAAPGALEVVLDSRTTFKNEPYE